MGTFSIEFRLVVLLYKDSKPMSAVNLAMRHIRSRIPLEILTKAFKSNSLYEQHSTVSMDWLIQRDVINNLVLPDLNVIGGEHVDIDLSSLSPRIIEGAYVYEIPLTMTRGKHITRVLSVSQGTGSSTAMSSDLMSLANQMLQASTRFETDETSRVRLVGPNIVVVEEGLYSSPALRCALSYDEQMSSLNEGYWRDFAQLCVWACEIIIFNRLSISLGSGSALGGTVNDRLMSSVNLMEESIAKYDEFLDTKAHKIFLLGDKRAHREHIQALLY